MPDIITTLDSLGFSNSQITYTIDNYSGSTQEVVDIPPISHDMIHKGKIVLCETVKKDSLMLWDSILDRLKVKIDKKLDSLSQTKLERLALYESKNVELDEISKNRITKLPQIQGAHENEAKFIVDTIHSLRDDYTSTLKTIFKDTKDFLNFTANDTLTRLKKCRSIIEITRLRKQYSIMVEQFHLDVKEGMYKCNGSFSLGKKMLGRSKTQGNHSSAWLIIKEKGQYDPNTALTLMENWRITMEDEMGKIQKDVTNQIRFAQKEFESYLQDFELIEYVDAKLRKLRMLVKGEVIWGSKLQGEFQKSIEHYNTTLNATSTWKDILQLLNEARDIELSIAHFAKYLSYSKNSLSTANSFDSVVEEWDLWKHLPSMETALPQIGQHESEIKMTITPSNSELRSMIASAKPIPFHGGQDEENELITQESLDNINLFENQDSLPDILSSPRVESRGADLLEKEVSTKGTPPKVNKSVTIENTKSTNREDSKTNSKSNKIVKEETRPATKPSSKEDPKFFGILTSSIKSLSFSS
ncbi:hypothetical protein BC833DRAFT_168237 [Globomyces pollinis-pini]|nr:hypothetical protein BC833DRAFT_168237 [Globomyces pollinis-pini]